jgi:hypothetical protein
MQCHSAGIASLSAFVRSALITPCYLLAFPGHRLPLFRKGSPSGKLRRFLMSIRQRYIDWPRSSAEEWRRLSILLFEGVIPKGKRMAARAFDRVYLVSAGGAGVTLTVSIRIFQSSPSRRSIVDQHPFISIRSPLSNGIVSLHSPFSHTSLPVVPIVWGQP